MRIRGAEFDSGPFDDRPCMTTRKNSKLIVALHRRFGVDLTVLPRNRQVGNKSSNLESNHKLERPLRPKPSVHSHRTKW